ncbi:uncharacterized protein BDV17DRAFT_239542 [Aspergillus undulatus]|uniref:uncharacterized protein n=1 Tax=Aspergillus undulatus TaxID=1810928 RepID=UPI003CCD6FBA
MMFWHDRDSEISAIQRELRVAMNRDFMSSQYDNRNGSKAFLRRERLEGIWTDKRLNGFRNIYNSFRREDIPQIKENYLQTLSILIDISWDGWSRFRTIFLEHGNRTDKDIPENDISKLEQDTFLGDWAMTFFLHRHIFCPVDIEGVDRVLDSDDSRLPFLKRKKIGQGAFGTVTKACVATRHFRYRDGSQVPFVRDHFPIMTDIQEMADCWKP